MSIAASQTTPHPTPPHPSQGCAATLNSKLILHEEAQLQLQDLVHLYPPPPPPPIFFIYYFSAFSLEINNSSGLDLSMQY